MTAYVTCVECDTGVPWYYAWLNGSDAMHPGCAMRRADEEGCHAIAAEIRASGWRQEMEMEMHDD